MKTLFKPVFLVLPLLAWFGSLPFQASAVQQDIPSPTPTYDPLIEPLLPPNPTEFELGQNLYWHWCMPCHGDRGQGLTDEFRGVWEPDHQNCWGRGCHAGRKEDLGFPIPTVVPAVVTDSHLAQFVTVQGLAEYLQTTHPPQSPGILKAEEYHAIALYVFSMNARSLVDMPVPATAPPAPMPTPTVAMVQEVSSNPFSISIGTVVIALAVGILLGIIRLSVRKSGSK